MPAVRSRVGTNCDVRVTICRPLSVFREKGDADGAHCSETYWFACWSRQSQGSYRNVNSDGYYIVKLRSFAYCPVGRDKNGTTGHLSGFFYAV